MALERTIIDGRIDEKWTAFRPGDTEIHVIRTGPASGPVTTEDGTTYDLTPERVQVADAAHRDEVLFLIAKQHEASGKLTDWAAPQDPITRRYDGPPVVVVGDKTGFHLAYQGSEDTPVEGTVYPPPA